eukprot:1157199-Pelagomonas_calceolata.AAC.4
MRLVTPERPRWLLWVAPQCRKCYHGLGYADLNNTVMRKLCGLWKTWPQHLVVWSYFECVKCSKFPVKHFRSKLKSTA